MSATLLNHSYSWQLQNVSHQTRDTVATDVTLALANCSPLAAGLL